MRASIGHALIEKHIFDLMFALTFFLFVYFDARLLREQSNQNAKCCQFLFVQMTAHFWCNEVM